jgi:hypothetical protein
VAGVTDLDHVLAIIAANDRRYEQRFEAQATAIVKAEEATADRFRSVNEFRGTLGDQQRQFIARSEVEEIRRSLDANIGALKERVDASLSERQGLKGGYAIAVAAVGLFGLVAGIIIAFSK